MLALISTVMPRADWVTFTWPFFTSEDMASITSLAMVFICSVSLLVFLPVSILTGAALPIGLPVPGRIEAFFWVMLIIRSVVWISWNALTMESDRTRYLPSLIEEMAYITTKKANSRVMKSA